MGGFKSTFCHRTNIGNEKLRQPNDHGLSLTMPRLIRQKIKT